MRWLMCRLAVLLILQGIFCLYNIGNYLNDKCVFFSISCINDYPEYSCAQIQAQDI